MDGPTRNNPFWVQEARGSTDLENDPEYADLLDLSEPFAWQMPTTAFQANARFQTGQSSRPNYLPPLENFAYSAQPATSQHPRAFHDSIRAGRYAAFPSIATSSTQLGNPSGYMQRNSAFSLDSSIVKEDKDEEAEMFSAWWAPGSVATISYIADDGETATISDLDPDRIARQCPLLALALEPSKSGPKLHLEILTSTTAGPFTRYLSTGSYAVDSSDGDIFENVPTSVLLHCRLYHLGVIYDLPDLRTQASVNIIRQCEFGCSSPDQPLDLCPAIAYAYEHLHEHPLVIDTIVNYCVSCFLQHRLGTNFEFRQLAYDLRPFHQDLCRNSMNREFENETATAIIQMPFKPYVPETYASREDVSMNAYTDYVHHFHSNDDPDSANKKRKRPTTFTLPIRESLLTRMMADEEQTGKLDPQSSQDAQDAGKANMSRKRRASSVVQPTIKSEPDSEPEYEVVAGPAPVEELSSGSDYESDAATLVVVERPEPSSLQAQRSPPARPRPRASASTEGEDRAEGRDSGSESDWTLV